MAHFAKIDKDNIVTQVVVSEQDYINSGALGDSFLWVQTSYNNNFRKQFAAVGYTYDKVNDVFIIPEPFPSWSLNSDFDWEDPVAKSDGTKTFRTELKEGELATDDCWVWDEDEQEWVEEVYDEDLDGSYEKTHGDQVESPREDEEL